MANEGERVERIEELARAVADELGTSVGYAEGVLRGLRVSSQLARRLDYSGCVAVQYHHSIPRRTVLASQTPDGLVVYPPEERAVDRVRAPKA